MALEIYKVLISDKVDESCKNILEGNSINVDYKPGLNPDDLKSIIEEYDALIVRSATKVTAELLEHAQKLKLIGRAGTGVDNIDLSAASKRGILVMNTPGGNTLSAAEHTCAMIQALARNIGQGHASMQAGKWERSKFMGSELMGKTLAIIGLGRIGKEVALRLQSFGMKTIGYDPIVNKEEVAPFNIDHVPLETIWQLADFITVHVPLIPPTKGMINKKVFEVSKPDVKVVNVARGGIIDENDLLEALNSGKCGGAALDVFVEEPPKGISFELVQHPKVLATPHLGASTKEAQLRVAQEIAQQIVDGKNGKPLVGLVNAPALSEVSNPVYKPWMDVAEKLGLIHANSYKGIKEITLAIAGDVLSSARSLMVAAYSFGFARTLSDAANLVSATSITKEAGVKIKTTHLNGSSPLLSVRVNEQNLLQGSVVDDKPALTVFDGVTLASPLSLTENLLTASSTTLTQGNLMKLLAAIEPVSISTGSNGVTTVAVGAIVGLANPEDPVKLIQL